jgi:phospholipid/cholesterol/gamma-HCH transport system substrate-binding protein
METRASYLAAGMFVISTVIGVIFFVLWMSQFDWEKGQRYDIYFSGSVTGLRQNEVVSYNGVPIGKVETIDINPKKVDLVHVSVIIYEPKLIRENSYATLESKGITGTVQIRILGSSRDSPSLKAKPGEEYPVIRSQSSAFQAVVEETPKILSKLLNILDDMGPAFSKENIQAFSRSLRNFGNFSDALSRQNKAAGEILNKINLMLDTIDRAGNNFGSAMGQFDKFLSENRPQVRHFTTSGLQNLSSLVINIDNLSKMVERVAEKLDRNPAQYIFQPTNQGETIPE